MIWKSYGVDNAYGARQICGIWLSAVASSGRRGSADKSKEYGHVTDMDEFLILC